MYIQCDLRAMHKIVPSCTLILLNPCSGLHACYCIYKFMYDFHVIQNRKFIIMSLNSPPQGKQGSGDSVANSNSSLGCHGMHAEDDESLVAMEEKWFLESQIKFEGMKWYLKPRKLTLCFILGLHTLSFTILMGPMMVLMLRNICTVKPGEEKRRDRFDGHLPHVPHVPHNMSGHHMGNMNMGMGMKCDNPNSQQELSNVQSILSIISGVLGFVLSGKYGQLGDRFGRVFVFKIFSIINLVHSVCLVCYFLFHKSYSRVLMILFSSTGFFSGGIMTLISNGNGYLNDIVTSHGRTIAISFLMSSIYVMLGFGPLLGSFLIKFTHGNSMVPLYASLLFSALSTILVFTILSETRHPEAMKAAAEKQSAKEQILTSDHKFIRFWKKTLSTFTSLFHPIRRLWLPKTSRGSLIPRINVLSLIFIDVFNMAATVGTFHVMVLYCILKYLWTGVEIGYYMSMGGFGRALVLLSIAPLTLKLLEKKLNLRILSFSVDRIDQICIIISLIFVFLSLVSVLTIDSGTGVYLNGVLQSLSGMVSPTIQSAVIKYSDKVDAGEMFGAVALVRHLAMLFLPVFFLQVYSHTVSFSPGLFLWIPLIGSIITIVIAIFFLRIEEESLDAEYNPLNSGDNFDA